ncbi:MAG: hypothetical protein LBC20_04860 [Planctomycetaceae bacterium]|jgi:hypothetical protein|nr:hypothetical protein [Planctomycetaceae bacterium]
MKRFFRSKKIFCFGFGQLRFIIAAVLFFAAGLKTHQLATIPLPPPVQGSVFTPLLELLNHRGLLIMVTESEILFALLLCSGIWRRWVWLVSLLCFSAFSLVSAMKGLSGEGSCGCFGIVTVNPWITATVDAILVLLLIIFREHSNFSFNFSVKEKRKLIIVLIVWFVLGIPSLLAMLSLKQFQVTLGTEMTSADGRKKIVLEPEKWIGKEFPLAVRFEQPADSELLKQKKWTIVLIHADCPKCRKLIADMESRNATKVALIDIPSREPAVLPKTSFPVFKLDENNDWFVPTPYIIEISDGICISVNENP